MRRSRRRRGIAAAFGGTMVAALAVPLVLAGCEAQQQAERRASAREFTNKMCQLAPDDTVIAVAIYGFIAQADPPVGRFVFIPGTDSSLPPAGTQALEDRGPTYMYSADPAQQAVVVRQLNAVGDYPTLLVAYHGFVRSDPLHPVVTLSGAFVSGPPRGKSMGVRAIAPQCDSTGAWRVVAPTGGPGAG